MREAIDAGESARVTVRNYRKDGTPFYNEVTLSPIVDEGETSHYVGFQQDVTDREEYERQLERQRNDLDVLNQMITHDIRNSLQVVRARAELLEESDAGDDAGHLPEIRDHADDAVEIAETARGLSRTMLDDDARREDVSLRESLREEVEETRASFDDATVELSGTVPDATVEADEMLGSVFRNLLTNAIQHNDEERPTVEVSVSRVADGVVVRVADDGPGIPDDLKDEVFDRGKKGGESDGTGVGTYLVDALVTRYGGEVSVADGDLGGAAFTVRLPTVD